MEAFWLILSPSCFAACGQHLSPRMAIVFSLPSSVLKYYMSRSSMFFSSNTSRFSSSMSNSPTTWVLISIALPHGHICASTSFSSRLLVYLFLLSGRLRSSTWNRSSAFSGSRAGRANMFSCLSISLGPPGVSLCVSPLLPYFLAQPFPSLCDFFPLLSCTPQKFSMDCIYSWFPPIAFHTMLTTLSHLIPARPFCYCLPYSSISYGWQRLLACSLLYIAISTFSRFYLSWVGTFSVLLIILYHSLYLSTLVFF